MNANGRRQRQAKINNAQWSGKGVSRRRSPDVNVSAARTAERVRRERERLSRGAKK
jgi:hypothetical protein